MLIIRHRRIYFNAQGSLNFQTRFQSRFDRGELSESFARNPGRPSPRHLVWGRSEHSCSSPVVTSAPAPPSLSGSSYSYRLLGLEEMFRLRFLVIVRTYTTLSSRSSFSWKPTGKPQQTLASVVERTGTGLHSGASATVSLIPAMAGEGRYFVVRGAQQAIPATVDHVIESALCTTLRCGATRVRTVEHLLSVLEASGVDNARIEVDGVDEVPILDGSGTEWVKAVEEAGLCAAEDHNGNKIAKLAPSIREPVYLYKEDSFIAAFPCQKTQITYGISFLQAPAIGCQWFSCFPMDDTVYSEEIGPSRTFCIYEQIESLRGAGLILGGSLENAIICSCSAGWLNSPLRFPDEPCRHKVLDLIGDLSLLAQNGNQGLPIAHIVAYKAGHALHAKFAQRLKDLLIKQEPLEAD